MRGMMAISVLVAMVLSGCVAPQSTSQQPSNAKPSETLNALSKTDTGSEEWARAVAQRFVNVVKTVEPVAERECRNRSPRSNCDYLIVVDDRRGRGPNAFQTINEDGRPVIAFTLALIAEVRNADELAFVMSHEAAHHIKNHIARQRVIGKTSADTFGALAASIGADAEAIRTASQIGSIIGGRAYSKKFELEADYLGAQIARAAGFDALNGAAYFTRIPDPGDQFLGTHPPNANRMQTVRRALGKR